MMKRNWLSATVLAAAMMVCSVSYADPFVDTGIFNADPVYAPTALIVTDPPYAPAIFQNNDGFTAMAGGYDVVEKETTCNSIVASMACSRMSSVAYFQLNTADRMQKTVLALGAKSELDDVPTKIPI